MNCCNHNTDGNEKKNNTAHKKGHLSHMWMMALCCGAPLLLLFAIPLLGTGFTGLKTVLLGVLPFICPIMMIAMIPMMLSHGKHNGDCHEEKQNLENERKSLETKQLNPEDKG